MAKRGAAAAKPQEIVGEPECVVEDDYRPAPPAPGRCAVCGMGAGASPSGEDLGPLRDHPLDGSVPLAEQRRVHAGCASAALVARSSTEPLTASPYPPEGDVHLLLPEHARDASGNAAGRRAVCGVEAGLGEGEVEWSIYVAGHPRCCAACGAGARGGERAARIPRRQ